MITTVRTCTSKAPGCPPPAEETVPVIDPAKVAAAPGVTGHQDQRRTERFGGALRIGIGINTGVVIAGTIGGGGKLELL